MSKAWDKTNKNLLPFSGQWKWFVCQLVSSGIGWGGWKLEGKEKETPAGEGHHQKDILHLEYGHPGGRGRSQPPGLYFFHFGTVQQQSGSVPRTFKTPLK